MTPLGKVADIVMGQSPDSKLYSEEEVGLPFLQGCAEFGRSFPQHKLFCRQRKKLAHTGSILFSVRAPVGKSNIADRDYVIGRGLASISGTIVSTQYLKHFLQFEEDQFRVASQGSTFEAINSAELSQWPVTHPMCMKEQRKIAEILSTVDRAIEQTEALIAKQQRIKTCLMQDLLTRGIDENGNLRSEKTHQFKDSPLGRIPVEWETGYFESCISGSPTNGIYKPQSAYGEQGTPIIRINGFGHGDRIKAQPHKRVMLSKSEIDQYRLEEGEILINRVNSIQYLGKTALVEYLPEVTVFESNMMRLTIDLRRMLPDFALLLLTGPAASRHFLSNAKLAIAQASINQHDVTSLLVQRPHLEEQGVICERIDSTCDSIKNTFSGLKKLHRVKTALMQDLLTGKRRVTSLGSHTDEVNEWRSK